MKISLIAALTKNRVIGRTGDMPWHLPADLAWFKKTTLGHFIVMGRKTWESVGRALPGRTTVVITRQDALEVPLGVRLASSLDDAIRQAEEAGEVELFITGGGQIYREAFPQADRLYLTHIDVHLDGDTFFPSWDPSQWKQTYFQERPADDRNAYPLQFAIYEREENSPDLLI